MDKISRREWVRSWIEVGIREGATFKSIAERAGVNVRTIWKWNKLFRAEQAARGEPDRDPNAFVQLAEINEENLPRIEVVFPGERRVVVDGQSLIEYLANLLVATRRCSESPDQRES